MAEIIQSDDQKNQNQNNSVATPYTPGATTAQSGSQPAQAPSASPAPTVGAGAKQGSGFTNIQRIAQASEGNKLGNTVQQGVQNDVNAVTNKVTGATNDFKTQATAGASGLTDYANSQDRINDLLAHPETATADDIANFGKYRSQSYGGPTQLGNLSGLQANAASIQALGQLAGTPAGTSAVLQKYVGAGQNYGQGAQKLDSLLLGQGAGAALNQARIQAATIPGSVQKAETDAEALAKQYQDQATNQTADINNKLGGAESSILGAGTTAQTAAQTAEKARSDLTNDINARISRGDYTGTVQQLINNNVINADQAPAVEMAIKSASPAISDQLPAILQQVINTGGATGLENVNNFLTSDQVAKLNALEKLSGGTNVYAAPQYQAGQLGFDYGKFMSILGPNSGNSTAMEPVGTSDTRINGGGVLPAITATPTPHYADMNPVLTPTQTNKNPKLIGSQYGSGVL